LLVPTNYKVWYDFMFFQSLYIIFRSSLFLHKKETGNLGVLCVFEMLIW
jgi:hypothetical protein